MFQSCLFEVSDGQFASGVGPMELVCFDRIEVCAGSEHVISPVGPQPGLVGICQAGTTGHDPHRRAVFGQQEGVCYLCDTARGVVDRLPLCFGYGLDRFFDMGPLPNSDRPSHPQTVQLVDQFI